MAEHLQERKLKEVLDLCQDDWQKLDCDKKGSAMKILWIGNCYYCSTKVTWKSLTKQFLNRGKVRKRLMEVEKNREWCEVLYCCIGDEWLIKHIITCKMSREMWVNIIQTVWEKVGH